jgi:short-subunit dehydrogenase
MNQKRWLLFGASRGLGLQVAKILSQSNETEILILSRKAPVENLGQAKHLPLDLAEAGFLEKIENLHSFKATHILYFAGGGPFGDFEKKDFKDHQWSWRVSFEAAAFVLHWALKQQQLQQICFIGSKIAESQPDPGAASYCAAKHALKGLVESVQMELSSKSSAVDLRLFSPGYMDTDLLPANAWPRQQNLTEKPAAVAEKLVEWLGAVC